MKGILFFGSCPAGKRSKSTTDGVGDTSLVYNCNDNYVQKMYEKNGTDSDKRTLGDRRRSTTEIIIIIIILKRQRVCNKSRREERRRGQVHGRTNDYNSQCTCLVTDLIANTQRVNGLKRKRRGKKRCFLRLQTATKLSDRQTSIESRALSATRRQCRTQ